MYKKDTYKDISANAFLLSHVMLYLCHVKFILYFESDDTIPATVYS